MWPSDINASANVLQASGIGTSAHGGGVLVRDSYEP